MKYFLYILVLFFLATSCNTSKKVTTDHSTDPEPCEAIIFTKEAYNNIETDYYTIDSLFIENNCLNIWVSYSGGCGDAEFTLLYNNRIMESFPPKTSLMLQFKDMDDCRAIVQQKLYYNLSFFDDYAKDSGISLRLTGIGKSVLYKN